MKALLTSAGLSNDSIRGVCAELLGKPIEEASAVQIVTAMYAMDEGVAGAWAMAEYFAGLGWRELGLLELTALPSIDEAHWWPALESADILLVGGGVTMYLAYWFERSGLAARLPELLEDTVYLGLSAGSLMLTPGQNHDPERLARDGIYHDDEYDEPAPTGAGSAWGAGLVDFAIRPHLGSDDFPMADMAMMERAAAKFGGPLYALDDASAIKVDGDRVEVVSEGTWKLLNAG